MIYFQMLRDFACPSSETHRSQAQLQILNGLSDMLMAAGMVVLAASIIHGRGGALTHPLSIIVMALAFSFGGALGFAKWIGAWRLLRRPRAA